MRSYAVIDRYITDKYREVNKVLGYFDNYDKAFDRADRARRVYNKLHDIIIVPLVSEPRADWTFMRGADIARRR